MENEGCRDELIWETAVDWLMRQHDGGLSTEELEVLRNWLGASSANQAAYYEVEGLWTLTGLVPPAGERN